MIDASVSMHRTEVPVVPMDAIREALFNAFGHRRYEDLAAVQADIFWDKADIYSPGGFPAGVSPAAYMSGEADASRPRNPLIVRTLYRSGDIEAYGTGLQRIKAACDAQGTPVEVFERGGSVHVSFTRQEALDDSRRLGPFAPADNPPESAEELPTNSDKLPTSSDKLPTSSEVANRVAALPGNERRAYEYMLAHGADTATQVAEALGVTPRTVRNVMARLAEKGLVTPSGANKNRTYSLRSDGSAPREED